MSELDTLSGGNSELYTPTTEEAKRVECLNTPELLEEAKSVYAHRVWSEHAEAVFWQVCMRLHHEEMKKEFHQKFREERIRRRERERIIKLLEDHACPDTCKCSQNAWTEEAIMLIIGANNE